MASASETSMSQFSPDMIATSPRPGAPRSRTHSISSDRPSTAAQSVMSPPLAVSPEAAFIATSAASQIVTNDHDSHADTWYDQHGYQPSGESVVVSNAALRQLNNFLDHLLFNFLAISGSTALSNLRPAVSEVLKPKLAKDAINNADEELREYLGGGDDEEFLQSPASVSSRDWDLELVWKRTRLRCMVYSSLGDMEEEEEDHHMEEGLLGDEDDAANVSPAVAIFLTSILEYLGEQALISAVQAAWNRMRIKYEKELKDPARSRSDVVDRLVVEDFDMERVALDRTLGRLWRAWKKRVRSGPGSVDLSHRPASREKMYRARLGSLTAPDEGVFPAVEESVNEPEEAEREELDGDERAAAVPLPMSDRDIDEIEVPGLVHYSDDESEHEEPDELDLGTRPKSMMVFTFSNKTDNPRPTMSPPTTPTQLTRKRANSLPTPTASPYNKREKLLAAEDAAESAQPSNEGALENVAEPTEEGSRQAEDAMAEDEDAEPESKKMSYRLSGPLTGAAAAAAASAVVASALATSKQVSQTHEDEEVDTDFEEIEEAQIMTSSRISIGGSISGREDSPASSERSRSSRPPLSISTMPVRSGSLRVVDVSSPRTPSTRSQRSSMQQEQNTGSNYSRSQSRSSSLHTQQNLDEPQAEDIKPQRISGTSAVGKPRSNLESSISEEDAPESTYVTPMSAIYDAEESMKEPVYMGQTAGDSAYQERTSSRTRATQPMFGSVKRHSPASSQQASPTSEGEQQQQLQEQHMSKGSAFSSPPDSATFMSEDEVGPLPPRYPKQSPRQYNQPTNTSGPVVPDKSRYRHGQSSSGGAQPGSIGMVSVDRSANGDGPRPPAGRPHAHSSASSASSNKVRPARVSQDSTATRPEESAKDFEELIRSNETIQYTLTPETMREIEVWAPKQRALDNALTPKKGSPKSLSSRATKERSGSTATVNRPVEVKRTPSVTRATGLRSHPVDVVAEDKARPPLSMANRRGPAPQARDARLPRESILEFADFIRATGPPGAQTPPSQPNIGMRRNQSMRQPGSPAHAAPMSKPSLSISAGRPPVSGGSVSRARLQARDATVDVNDNSDLIDFIRQGPSSGANPRIPRTVAPFRTTMDSDQMQSAVGGRAMDASIPDVQDTRASQASKASTNVTEMSAPSYQSSVNSQSALLGRNQVTAQPGSNSPWDDSDMMPVRKQRRVRDPYAIDFSDEEDEEDDEFEYQPTPKRKPAAKEESLMDFLNSVPPPSSSEPVPFNLSSRTNTAPSKAPAPKKKASAPSLMSRFRQNSAAAPAPAMPSYGTRSGSVSQPSKRAPASNYGSGTSSSANKGYIPIQVNIPTGGVGDLFPSYGNSSASATITSSSRTSGRVPMKKFEPRDAVSVPSRGTSDLAEFLRSSEPPGAMASVSWSKDASADSGGSKLFGRRKKSTGFA
ncbi:hypothetical protein N0V82_010271 [Gnomoniopsis sp. IMI 355080]|nr:hypothetical protein N0V82_010271 [Gnomoniopsis sp. IMI 355080]